MDQAAATFARYPSPSTEAMAAPCRLPFETRKLHRGESPKLYADCISPDGERWRVFAITYPAVCRSTFITVASHDRPDVELTIFDHAFREWLVIA